METGNYNDHKNWEKYEVSRFPLHLYYHTDFESVGCGANALALITGDNPFKIRRLNKYRSDYTDAFMLKYLRQHKIKCLKLTKSNITNKKNNSGRISYDITSKHVILISQLLSKAEASWFVIYDDLKFHNFSPATFTGLGMLNCPISSAYCLFNPQWSTSTK